MNIHEMDRQILGDIWTSSESYDTLVHLCDVIGHRFGGSESERLGAEYLRDKMIEYGLENVHIEEFPMASWQRGSCSLAIAEPFERELSAIALPYCPSAHIQAEMIDVGDGEEEDFERLGDAIRDKIVLTNAETNKPGVKGRSHRNDKFARAIAYGAAACVFMNQNPGLLRITGSILGSDPTKDDAVSREAPIPGIGISYEAGMTIRRFAKKSALSLKIDTDNTTFESTSRNVIGEIPGSELPNEVVVIGAHFDGHDVSQGAGDDAAGTMSALEAGRALASLKGKIRRTIRIVAFGSEEIGLLGSNYHARVHCVRNPKETYRFVLNLDGAGRGETGTEFLRVLSLPDIQAYFEAAQDDMHYRFDVADVYSQHSDQFPFAVRGIPNSQLITMERAGGLIGRGWGHTEADTVDKVHLRGLQISAALGARLALRIAQDDSFPSRRLSEDEVRTQLTRAGILQRQIDEGVFPPRD